MSIEAINSGVGAAQAFATARKQTGAAQEDAVEATAQAQDNATQAQGAVQSTDKVDEVQKSELPTAVDLKTDQNRAILEATMQVSIDSGNDSLALMLKAAIEGINKELVEGNSSLIASASIKAVPEGASIF